MVKDKNMDFFCVRHYSKSMVRNLFLLMTILGVVGFFFPGRLYGATADERLSKNTPQLSVLSPVSDSVTNSRVELQFAVSNFTLTTRPNEDKNAGVIALYLDDKFYNNVASTSAIVQLPRIGTHKIEAELVHTNRQPVLPRVSQSVYLHNQRKTPHISFSNLKNGATIYAARPLIEVDLRRESYEDQNTYYQVFVDGVVDGDSLESEDPKKYVLQNELKPGKHTLRVALYNENGKPYSPVVDSSIALTYAESVPSISALKMSDVVKDGEAVAFEASFDNFTVPENGYLVVSEGDSSLSFSASSGVLDNLSQGEHAFTFELVDLNGLPLVPPVIAEKVVQVGGQTDNTAPVKQARGIFETGESGIPRWGWVGFAGVQALVILVFGLVLISKHKKHHVS